eukprot:SAG22_NODE_455_length_10287_cov_1276.978406_3_plen_89_part_00
MPLPAGHATQPGFVWCFPLPRPSPWCSQIKRPLRGSRDAAAPWHQLSTSTRSLTYRPPTSTDRAIMQRLFCAHTESPHPPPISDTKPT